MQHLDGDAFLQLGVLGFEHASHAAATELSNDLVLPQASWEIDVDSHCRHVGCFARLTLLPKLLPCHERDL
jgi:hypothetical protein